MVTHFLIYLTILRHYLLLRKYNDFNTTNEASTVSASSERIIQYIQFHIFHCRTAN